MFRVCYEIGTHKIIEVQSGGDTADHLQTLIDNAVSAGWDPAAITCEFMDDAQYEHARLIDSYLQAQLDEAEAKEAAKKQAIAEALVGWRDDLNAIEVKIDALSQPYRGIFKDIIQRIRKNTRVLSWMFNNNDR